MSTTTPRLGLVVPETSDQFDTAELAANWEALEDLPGVFITTVSNEPTWGSAHNGMFLTYSDNGLTYRWDGSAFQRAFSKGWLAQGARTTDLAEASGSYTILAQATGVAVPGDRRVGITVSWSEISGDAMQFGLFRGSTQLTTWRVPVGVGGSMTFFDAPTAGSYTFSVQVKKITATSTVECAADAPARIDVWEA